jgi:hypothetical protein
MFFIDHTNLHIEKWEPNDQSFNGQNLSLKDYFI